MSEKTTFELIAEVERLQKLVEMPDDGSRSVRERIQADDASYELADLAPELAKRCRELVMLVEMAKSPMHDSTHPIAAVWRKRAAEALTRGQA